MTYYIKNDYLEHHGIHGQKWGVRHGPPYPLSSTEHNSVVKGNSRPSRSAPGSTGDASIAVSIATYAAVTAIMTHHYKKQAIERMENIQNTILATTKEVNECKTMKDLNKSNSVKPTSENVKDINPDYPEEGFVQNCTFCTTAMAMQEKGYDVKALCTPMGMNSKKAFNDWFPGCEQTSFGGKLGRGEKIEDRIFDTLSKQPEGSYGNLNLQWNIGGGHSVFYKVENGKATVYDGQSGKIYNKQDFASTFSKYLATPKVQEYYRLDNVEPSEKVLSAVCNKDQYLRDVKFKLQS